MEEAKFSFDIRNHRDFYAKLKREYIRYLSDDTNTDYALNFAWTAFHLFDSWVQEENKPLYNKMKKLFGRKLKIEAEIIRDICQGTKHFDLPTPNIVSKTDYSGKGFTKGFSFGPALRVTINGRRVKFHEVAPKIMKAWDDGFNVP